MTCAAAVPGAAPTVPCRAPRWPTLREWPPSSSSTTTRSCARCSAAICVRAGLEVDEAGDGEAALRAFETGHPDLVVLDLTLPRIDGLEVFRRMRAVRGDLPVVMLTARGEESDRVLGLEVGADDYITKPFSNRELVLRVQSILRRVAARPPTAAPARDRPRASTATPAGPIRPTGRRSRPSSTVTSGSTGVATRSGSATCRSPSRCASTTCSSTSWRPRHGALPACPDDGRVGLGLRRRGHRDRARAPPAREGRARPVAAHCGSRRSGASATAGTARRDRRGRHGRGC